MKIRRLTIADEDLISEFYTSNWEHLEHWEPQRDGDYHSEKQWKIRLSRNEEEYREGR